MYAYVFFVEPILGWRVWRLRDEEPVLESVIYGDHWPCRARFEAGCDRRGPRRRDPCGVHAARTREQAVAIARWADGAMPQQIVLGRVSLWGRVVEHEGGYRAEYAYPYALEVLAGRRRPEEAAAQLRAAYLVDALPISG